MADLYEELVQLNVDVALSEEELETSDRIEKIVDGLDESLEDVEVAVEEEVVVPKGSSEHKRRRHTLKKHRNKCTNDFLPRKKNMKKPMNYLMEEIVFLKQILMQHLCV